MTRMKHLLAFLVAAAFFTPGLQAQSLTSEEAVCIALKNSLGIQLARNYVDIAAIDNSYGIAGGLPLVTGNASDQEQSTSLKQEYADQTLNKQSNNAFSNNLSAGLNASMLLYNGQRVVTAKKRLGVIEAQNRNHRIVQVAHQLIGEQRQLSIALLRGQRHALGAGARAGPHDRGVHDGDAHGRKNIA